MALSIRNPETEKLAREVAKKTGENLTEAITKSLAERLDRLDKRNDTEEARRAIDEILARVDALPDLDTRTADEIIGYDENGLPS